MRRVWWALLRVGFRLLYREMAWSYDLVSWVVSFGHWRDWQRAAMHYARGPRVLDLASGTGNFLLDWYAWGVEPVGVDLSSQMVRIAARKLRAQGLPLSLTRGRAQALPFADETFDSVVSTFPAGFIVDRATLAEVRRVLRPAGRIVVVLSAYLTGRGPLSRFARWLAEFSLPADAEPVTTPMSFDSLGIRREEVPGDGWVAIVWVGEKQG